MAISVADLDSRQTPSYQVWLSVTDFEVSPQEISARLGLDPTREFVKGLPTPPMSNGNSTNRIAVQSRWELLIPVGDDRPLRDHFSVLESILTENVVTALREISLDGTVRIEVVAICDDGITIPSTLISRASLFNAEIDIDTGE